MGLQGAINSWMKQYGCSLGNPVEANILNEAVSELGLFPIELLELYQYCNGLTFRWFKVLPIEDKQNIKQNWDGLEGQMILERLNILVKTRNYYNAS